MIQQEALNNTLQKALGVESLTSLFEKSVSSYPNKIAIFHNEESISYSELNCRANSIANYLLKLGTREGKIVAILLERSISLITGILGVLKTGAAYVVIDAEYPKKRIEYILNDTNANLLLTEKVYKDLFESNNYECVYPSEILKNITYYDNIEIKSDGDTLACVIYTSGSTGNPKGTLLNHKSLYRLFNGPDMVQTSSIDSVAQIANTSFDAAIYEIWAALGRGGSLVVIDKEIVLSPQNLRECFKKYNITTAFLTTGLFNQLAKITPSIFKLFNNVLFGGEIANAKIVREIVSNSEFRPQKLFHFYGPTECGVFSTYYEVKTLDDNATSVPIGVPVNSTQLYILNDHLERVQLGEVGELYISGHGIARGYLNLPDLTAERFIACPFDVNFKMYKTGDLVRMLPDGMLDFVGRKDNQVKVRGHRIELEEIECALESYPAIWKAVVVAPYTQQDHRQLIAYFVPKNIENKVTSESIKVHLRENLPDYMMPSIIFQLNFFPLTTHGKVDRKKLSELSINEDITAAIEPLFDLNEIEKILLKIWEKVLCIKNIQLNDNFFDLGGDSIMIMQMIAEAAENKITLTHSRILQHPTIQSLAFLAGNQDVIQQENPIDQTPFDLSAIQTWYFDQSFKNLNYFHHLFHSPLKEIINIDNLKKAIGCLIEYHDVFQLRFFKDDKKYRQYYSKEQYTNIVDEISIKNLSQAQVNKVVNEHKEQLCNSIDIHKGPLIKIAIFTNGAIPKSLMIVIHHLIIDGISWRILINDLSRIYKGLLEKGSYSLPSKGSSFKAWAAKTREYVLKKNLLQETKYWFNMVKNSFSLPIDHHKGPNIEASDRVLRKSLSPEITKGILKTIPHDLHVNINDILLTALFQAISEWSGQSEIILELEGHGREDIVSGNFARTVGWFTGLFPVSLKRRSESLKACLFDVQTQLKNIPIKGVGYGILKFLNNDADIRNQLSLNTAIPIRFNYLGQFDQNLNNDQLFEFVEEPFSSPSDPQNQRTNLLIIECWVTQGQFQVNWHYSDNYHCDETIEKLAVSFNQALEVLIEEAQNHAVDISLTQYNLKEINEILPNIKDLQSVYSLTPIQEGFLFHTIHDPKSQVYLIQTYWSCKQYDTKIMLAAWNALIMNHELFRTSYLWEGLENPIQVVHKETKIALIEEDWNAFSTEEQKNKLNEFLIQDRNFGIDLKEWPLMHLSTIRLSNNEQLIVWSFHHIIMDGWSVCRIIEELDHYYSTLLEGKSLILKKSPSFGNYIGWWKRHDCSKNKLFWDKYLDGFTSPNQNSFQKPIALNHQASYCRFGYNLSQKLSQSLYQYAKDNRVTFNTVMQGIWAYLLSIYCNTLDVVFGLTISTRPSEINDVNNIIGPLINTLPFRVIIDNNSSVSEFLQVLQDNLANVVDHSFYSHIDIQRGSQVTSGNHLFNSSFGFESEPVKELEKNLSNFFNIKINEGTHYPLSLYVIPGEYVQLKVSYDENIYSQTDIDKLINHYINLLSDLIQKIDASLDQLSCLSPEEFKLITSDWNQTEVALPKNTSFIDIFEKQVQENPQATAVIYNNDSLSYIELNERANQLAHHLQKLGIKNNNLIGIWLERSPEMLIAIFGILKIGAAYIPLDPINPSDRLNYIMEDSKASIIITSNKYDSLIRSNVKKIKIDSDWDLIAENQRHNPKRDVKLKDLVYVMYTSGSTGKPKGVMVHNLGFFNYLYSIAKLLGVQKKCNAPVSTSFAFDATVTSLFLPSFTGGAVTLIPQKNEIDTLYELLHSQEYYHVIVLTPAHLQALGDLFEFSQASVNNVGSFAISGEVLNEKILELWRIIAPQAKFINLYGPTETIVNSSLYDATVPDSKRASVPIGRPIANTQLYVLDEYMQPVPQGIVGELYIGGLGVAHGYLNKPDLSNEKFITDKFSKCPDAKLFRTGDLVRFQEDGNLEFLGRRDNQVKIRGFRIELQEIEFVLLEYDAIKETAVCVYKDSSATPHLIAYIVSRDEQELDIEGIRNHLSASLPQYMLPNYYIVIDKLPLNVNGKVDRKQLPEPKQSQTQKTYIPPRNVQEQKLVDIWARVLQKSTIGIDDNFFDQGGDSLIAVRLISQIRKEFKMEISIRSIFDTPTIKQLSELLTDKSAIDSIINKNTTSSGPSFIIPLQKIGDKRPLFLIHPIGGTVFCYLPLRNYINDRPIYGIEDPGINASSPHFNALGELANYYIKGIKKIQPEGPYLIGGASLGGLISIEIAKQLDANGESIEFIGLFDAWASFPEVSNQKDWFAKHMAEQLLQAGLDPKDPWLDLQWQRKLLALKYRVPLMSNKVILFKASTLMDVFAGHDHPTNFLDAFCSNLEVRYVPGDHYSMFDQENIAELAETLKQCIH